MTKPAVQRGGAFRVDHRLGEFAVSGSGVIVLLGGLSVLLGLWAGLGSLLLFTGFASDAIGWTPAGPLYFY